MLLHACGGFAGSRPSRASRSLQGPPGASTRYGQAGLGHPPCGGGGLRSAKARDLNALRLDASANLGLN